jgi:hypothetical protein
MRGRGVVAACLGGVIVSLLLVGAVGATPIRHLIQVTPAIIALVAVGRRVRWAPYAALPLFAFWLFIMIAIWLYLLGLARIITGHFTPAEIALTLINGAACLWGLPASVRTKPAASGLARLVASTLFLILQVAAMWASLRPAFARA